MQAQSLRRTLIDWAVLRASTLSAAGAAQTIVDTRPAIRNALALLGDGHSFYRATDGTMIYVPNRTCSSNALVPLTNVPADIGYVHVPSFSGSGEQAAVFATAIQNTIRSADHDSLAGWIVDLRGNGGGNMWPMVAGLGPIFGNDTLGYFVEPNGVASVWSFRDGDALLDSLALQRVAAPYTLRRPKPRVAVLVDNGVGSSGEAVFMSFRGRPQTRSFGVPTCGLSTANRGTRLSDGAVLQLTVATMADRNRVLAGDRIEPDEVIAGGTMTVNRAIAWLRGTGPGSP